MILMFWSCIATKSSGSLRSGRLALVPSPFTYQGKLAKTRELMQPYQRVPQYEISSEDGSICPSPVVQLLARGKSSFRSSVRSKL